MASFNEIKEKLGLGHKKPEDLTPEEWDLISEEMRADQEKAYHNRGERLGMRGNLTPKQQAEEDKKNEDLEDPTRRGQKGTGPERKG